MPLPKISLQNAVFQPTSFTGVQFTPVKDNLSLLQHSFDAIETRKEKTDQQKAQLQAAIGKLQLNEAEDKWKNNYINNIAKQIDNASQYGDYSTALEVATNLAGQVATDPALLTRERSNRIYQEEKRKIEANNSLDELTKQRWMVENPYYHNDVLDSNGNITGGSKWEAKFNPVADVDIAQLRALAAQLTAEESKSTGGSTTRQVLVDQDGYEIKNKTQTPADVSKTIHSGGTSSYRRKTKEKMARVWDSLKADPKIMQGLVQKYETYRWAYEDALKKSLDLSISDEERARYARQADEYKGQITDKDGIVYANPSTWAKATIIPGFADMEYNNTTSTGESSELYNENYFARLRAGYEATQNAQDINVTENVGVTGTAIRQNYIFNMPWINPDSNNSDSYDNYFNN